MTHERFTRVGFLSLGVAQLGLAIWLFFFPRSFHSTIGDFFVFNAHYERDVATFYLAFAVGSFAAASLQGWRIPVLVMTSVQYAVHTINHGIDVSDSGSSWAGPFSFISLGVVTLGLLIWLWILLRKTE